MTPTDSQMKVLRLMDAGARLLIPADPSQETRHPLVLPPSNNVMRRVTGALVQSLRGARWIARNDRGDRYTLTAEGRAVVSVRTVVAQFAEKFTEELRT